MSNHSSASDGEDAGESPVARLMPQREPRVAFEGEKKTTQQTTQPERKRKRKSISARLRRRFGKAKGTSEMKSVNIDACPNIDSCPSIAEPKKSILKRRDAYRANVADDGEEPSTSAAVAICQHKADRRRISFREDAKDFSTDDGMDDIDSLLGMMANVGYFFPLHFDWRKPASQLLRHQISVQLKLDYVYQKFMARSMRQLLILDDQRARELHLGHLERIRRLSKGLPSRAAMNAEIAAPYMEMEVPAAEQVDEENGDETVEENTVNVEWSDDNIDSSSSTSAYETCQTVSSSTSTWETCEAAWSPTVSPSDNTVSTTAGVMVGPTEDQGIDIMFVPEEDAKNQGGLNDKPEVRPKKETWWRRVLSWFSCTTDDTSDCQSDQNTFKFGRRQILRQSEENVDFATLRRRRRDEFRVRFT